MKRVAPCNDGNAIKIVTFAFEFEKPIHKNVVNKFIASCESDSDLVTRFPQCEKHQSMDIDAKNGDIITWTSGAAFIRLTSSAQLDWSFTVSPHNIVISCGVYTRWLEVFAQAKKILNEITPMFATEQSIGVVGLEFIDEFIINAEIDSGWAKELFRSDSMYVPGNVFKLNDYWHFTQGFFSECGECEAGVTLNNLVVRFVKTNIQPNQNVVSMATTHKSKLNDPMMLNSDLITGVASQLLESSHSLNKSIIKELLTDGICEEISLKA